MEKVISYCASCANESDTADAFNKISKDHRFHGPDKVGEDELGRITELKRSAGYISDVMVDYDDDTIIHYIEILSGVKPALVREKRAANLWLKDFDELSKRSGKLSPSYEVCWVFDPTTNNTPKEELSESHSNCLPYRLGLPTLAKLAPGAKLKYIGVIFSSNALKRLSLPTALDSDYYNVQEYWEPTGQTKPLDSCPDDCEDKSGLSEFVCLPPGYHERKGVLHVIST